MKKLGGIPGCDLFTLALTPLAGSAGTSDEAKALVAEAIAFYRTNGKEKALEEFSKTKGKFVKGDLYIFVFDPDGTIIAHGGDLKLVGRDFTGVQDPAGKYFALEFIKAGPDGGWVDYKWMNYAKKKVEAKTAYLKKIDDVIIGCGAYK